VLILGVPILKRFNRHLQQSRANIQRMHRLALLVFIAAWAILNPACSLGTQPERASYSPCVDTGTIRSVDDSRVVVKNDQGSRTFGLNQKTNIKSAHPLRPGDSVMVWCTAASSGRAIATGIVANLTRLAGTVKAVRPHSIQLAGEGGAGEVDGRLTVLLTASTIFVQGSRNDLRVGRDLEVTGYDLGHKRVQATALNIWTPQ
jgi:Domain of unknown function (DUF5666)